MSVINVLFGNRTSGGFQLTGLVEFTADVTIDELHERRAEVTEHPVESGARVSDHIILTPERVTINGFVSDAGVAVFGSQPGRTQSAFDALEDAWQAREPVSIVTGYKTYQDMVITRLNLPRNRPESMQFSIELQHVTIVSSQLGELAETDSTTAAVGEASSSEVADATGRTTQAGRQPTQPAGEATEEAAQSAKRQSTLAGFF